MIQLGDNFPYVEVSFVDNTEYSNLVMTCQYFEVEQNATTVVVLEVCDFFSVLLHENFLE
jgi:hypothetical protein